MSSTIYQSIILKPEDINLYRKCTSSLSQNCVGVGTKDNFRGLKCLKCYSFERARYNRLKKLQKTENL